MIRQIVSACFLDHALKAPVIITLVFLFSLASAKETMLSDVAGWQETWWGMSPTELKDQYGSRLSNQELNVKPPDASREILKINDYPLFGKDFEVQFFWNRMNKLSRVSIVTDTKFDSTLCEKLEASLFSKYGRGEIVEQEKKERVPLNLGGEIVHGIGVEKVKIRWTFPSTIITYECNLIDLGSETPPPNTVHITYVPNEAEKL